MRLLVGLWLAGVSYFVAMIVIGLGVAVHAALGLAAVLGANYVVRRQVPPGPRPVRGLVILVNGLFAGALMTLATGHAMNGPSEILRGIMFLLSSPAIMAAGLFSASPHAGPGSWATVPAIFLQWTAIGCFASWFTGILGPSKKAQAASGSAAPGAGKSDNLPTHPG